MEEKEYEIPISKENIKFEKVDGSFVFDLCMELDRTQQQRDKLNKELVRKKKEVLDRNKKLENCRNTIGQYNINNSDLQQQNKELQDKLDEIREYAKITYQEWYNWKTDILSILDKKGE